MEYLHVIGRVSTQRQKLVDKDKKKKMSAFEGFIG